MSEILDTVEQLDALPVGSVVLAPQDPDSCLGPGPWTKDREGWWHWMRDFAGPSSEIFLPVLLIWHPDRSKR